MNLPDDVPIHTFMEDFKNFICSCRILQEMCELEGAKFTMPELIFINDGKHDVAVAINDNEPIKLK